MTHKNRQKDNVDPRMNDARKLVVNNLQGDRKY